MKRPDIEAIQKRVNKATAGPWKIMGDNDHIIGNEYTDFNDHHQWSHNTTWDNAEFIAAARTDISDLLEYVKYLETLLKESASIIKYIDIYEYNVDCNKLNEVIKNFCKINKE